MAALALPCWFRMAIQPEFTARSIAASVCRFTCCIWMVMTAGLLAVFSLAGLWIVMFRLYPMEPNPLIPTSFTSSPIFVAAIVVGAALLAPISEESAVRGYLQSILERNLAPFTAVLLSSTVFALAHATQGLVWPKLLFYFLVGVAFGSLAYINQSILPVIPVHIAGDLIFLTLIWLEAC